jgi:2-polyprenyl-3-methyl-5-hydroxy-6-metoxy-1,4-benzoquinol methylase
MPFRSSGTATDSTAAKEEHFHDTWAQAEEVGRIDVRRANEACTAPELRCIHQRLGDLRGRRVLDLGCGRGETSVYFALHGAQVTVLDISTGMLDLTAALARRYGVSLRVHKADAQDLRLDPGEKFDVIHAANMLHHVDLKQTLPQMLAHLDPTGTFISWDPLAYNPIINLYRRMATQVRTEDEHPLRREDVTFLTGQFRRIETRWYWLSTLSIFMLMAAWQRRNPNKERYWKAVVDEADRWARLYHPLERLDKLVLRVFPPLRWWCWNVLIFGWEPVAPAPTT